MSQGEERSRNVVPTSTGPSRSIFIDIEVAEEVRGQADLAKKLEEVCPVDIFAARDGAVEVVDENVDECILCEMCVRTAPPGGVRVVKLYDDGAALER